LFTKIPEVVQRKKQDWRRKRLLHRRVLCAAKLVTIYVVVTFHMRAFFNNHQLRNPKPKERNRF
jgi:hypothetical protein